MNFWGRSLRAVEELKLNYYNKDTLSFYYILIIWQLLSSFTVTQDASGFWGLAVRWGFVT